jgi:hypothetical protein
MAMHDQDWHIAPVAHHSWNVYVSFALADMDASADVSSVAQKAEMEGEDKKLVLDAMQMAAHQENSCLS